MEREDCSPQHPHVSPREEQADLIPDQSTIASNGIVNERLDNLYDTLCGRRLHLVPTGKDWKIVSEDKPTKNCVVRLTMFLV